jgi:hypothetical protein
MVIIGRFERSGVTTGYVHWREARYRPAAHFKPDLSSSFASVICNLDRNGADQG